MDAAVEGFAREGQDDVLACLEALADPRVAGAGGIAPADLGRELARWFPESDAAAVLRELGRAGAVERDGRLVLAADLRPTLAAVARARPVEWAGRTLTQGELLDGFLAHCRDELDDVEVEGERPAGFTTRWRRETTEVELRLAPLFLDRLEGGPWLLLAPIGDPLCAAFVDEAGLRGRVSVWDVTRLEKIAAVRSSVLVYFEWFLRDAYGVKVIPAEAFTTGLVVRGIISLGMG